MISRRIKNLYLAISGLLLITLSIAFLYVMNKPHRTAKDEVAEYKLTASQLVQDFTMDESVANKKYLDKVLEVRGVLKEIEKEDSLVTLILSEASISHDARCSLIKGTNVREGLKVGDDVVIKGICQGMLFDVVIDQCVIVE